MCVSGDGGALFTEIVCLGKASTRTPALQPDAQAHEDGFRLPKSTSTDKTNINYHRRMVPLSSVQYNGTK